MSRAQAQLAEIYWKVASRLQIKDDCEDNGSEPVRETIKQTIQRKDLNSSDRATLELVLVIVKRTSMAFKKAVAMTKRLPFFKISKLSITKRVNTVKDFMSKWRHRMVSRLAG